MKHDHTFTFTAAVVLAGVVLAFVNPADANSAAPALAHSKTSLEVSNNANTLAAIDAPAAGAAAAKVEAKRKGSCERRKPATDPRA